MDKKTLKIALSIIIIPVIVLLICFIFFQSSKFFYPWHDATSYEQLLVEEQFEEIRIDNNGNLLSGWIKYNTKQQHAPLVIFFLGNAQNSSNMCLNFLYTDRYKYFEGYNVMVVDYPGYGLSDGKPSEKTMFDTAKKVYDYASELDCVDKNNIVVLGYSIGTGIATYLASSREVNGLILIAPYDEALSLYNSTINIFHGPLKLLARYKFKSNKYAKNVKVAPLIVTSIDDEVINYKYSLNLKECFKDVYKTIILDDNVKHNDYFIKEDVLSGIRDYLKDRL